MSVTTYYAIQNTQNALQSYDVNSVGFIIGMVIVSIAGVCIIFCCCSMIPPPRRDILLIPPNINNA